MPIKDEDSELAFTNIVRYPIVSTVSVLASDYKK